MNDNIFNNPAYYREKLLERSLIRKPHIPEGRPLICVFFTNYCVVGCPFCFFNSPKQENEISDKVRRENHFNQYGVERFIQFANDSHVGYLQISGGGEPFLELDAILQCVRKVSAKRIILVTSGYWAYNREQACSILKKLYDARKDNPSDPRLSIRVSISKDHSIKLKDRPLVNLISEFENHYLKENRFTLQFKFFEGDDTFENYLENWYPGYQLELDRENGSDDDEFIKIIPWKYTLCLPSGYKLIVGKSRVFFPTLRPDMNNISQIRQNNSVFDVDSNLSQNDFPSLVYGSNGTTGLDWIVEYNGNVCTWQNRVQDNLLNIYEDNYNQVIEKTMSDLITYSFIEKGSSYRNRIISEISPKTVSLMKAVNIRDYAGTLLFADEKIRLYYNIRVLQDYLQEGVIDPIALLDFPIGLQMAVKMTKEELIREYKSATYSIVDQEFARPTCFDELHDFLELLKLDHFEVSQNDVQRAIDVYNKFPFNVVNTSIDSIDEIESVQSSTIERRLTGRMMTRKIMSTEENHTRVILCRHGETNWNVEGRIKGQQEDLYTVFTEKGLMQIELVSQWLGAQGINAIFSSDLYRAKETSKVINAKLSCPIYSYDKFRGLNMGDSQGMLMREFLQTESAQKAFSNYDCPFPGGESINQLIKRFTDGLKVVHNNYHYDVVAVVSHGAAISNVRSFISGKPYKDIDYCVIEINNEKWEVVDAGTYNSLLTNI